MASHRFRIEQDHRLVGVGVDDGFAIPSEPSSSVEWSEALGDVPILVHAADADWIARPSPRIEPWSGPELSLSDDAKLLHGV